jgi:hypothetical protein
MTRICSPRSTSPRRRELSSLGGTDHRHQPDAGPYAMGRGCRRTLGRAVAGLNAYAKGLSKLLFDAERVGGARAQNSRRACRLRSR